MENFTTIFSYFHFQVILAQFEKHETPYICHHKFFACNNINSIVVTSIARVYNSSDRLPALNC